MDSELQDALNVFDHSDERMTARQWTTILEAARKYANLQARLSGVFLDARLNDAVKLAHITDSDGEYLVYVAKQVQAALGGVKGVTEEE